VPEKHPYTSGGGGALVQAINHLRKSFPVQVSAATLKKLGIAPNNESYIINILKFIKVIDDEGKRATKATTVFSKHEDADFQKGFSELVEEAYSELFHLHGKDAWALPTPKLISFFRSSDQTGDIVGQRQAATFQTLARLGGHGESPTAKPVVTGQQRKKEPASSRTMPTVKKTPSVIKSPDLPAENGTVGLTVRIEINLPVAADQKTYDLIFKSIRENLLRG
jgi:hypothetical protein